MQEETQALEPAALDGWLREQLGRSLVVIGFILGAGAPGGAEAYAILGTPPSAFVAALQRYQELSVRWLAAGMTLDGALTQAATMEADALLIWVPETSGSPGAREAPGRPAADTPAELATEPSWQVQALAAVIGVADAQGLHDRTVMAMVGPGASRTLARQLGYDDGFAMDTPAALVATAVAREAVASYLLRRGGSSPPCYL